MHPATLLLLHRRHGTRRKTLVGPMYGPEAALIAEAFTPRLRYSGASIGYQLASIIAGGPAPFISTWLFATYNSTAPIGIYVVICAVISIGATLMLRDYTNKDISEEAVEYAGV